MTEEIITGVFDSGVGGLSVLKKLLPLGGNYIYFGDTKHLPYGEKSKEQIIDYTRRIIKFFIKKGAKKVIMACNTSSALAYDTLHNEFGGNIEIYPLIQSAAPYIAKMADKIGVLATEGTVKSLSYTKEILKINKNAEVFETACPEFVPIVENRLYDEKESMLAVKKYLKILSDKGCQKIVLGCTHYPYLLPIMKKYAEENVFINPADFIVKLVQKTNSEAKVRFYVSCNPEKFLKNASIFMDINEKIYLENV